MTRYLSLAELFVLAEQVTGIDAGVLTKASRVDLADSAVNAPAAGFGDEDFYPDVIDKAAVLGCRIAWNHPLPDGNKRLAWTAMRVFLDLNGLVWVKEPGTDEAVEAMLDVAAHNVDENWLATWLRARIGPSD